MNPCAQTPNVPAAARGRPARQPSKRNLELYYELVCEGRLQSVVAARFGVSQPRVAQIRADVAAWVDLMLGGGAGPGSDEANPPQPLEPALLQAAGRFHLAVVIRQIRLEAAYEKFLGYFGGVRGAAGYGHLLAAIDAGVLPEATCAKLPSRCLIEDAVRMARELEAVDRITSRGPLAGQPAAWRAARLQNQ